MNTYYHPSTTKQRQVLLEALKQGPINTLEGRERLSIPHIAGRVCELRRLGYDIRTFKEWEHDSLGVKHLVAKYALVGGEA